MAIDGLQSPGNAWNEFTDANLTEQKATGTQLQASAPDPAMAATAIPFEDPKAVSDAKPAQIFFGDANPLENGVENNTKAGGEPESTAELLKGLIEVLQKLMALLGQSMGAPPPEGEGKSQGGPDSGNDAGQARRDDRSQGASSAEKSGAQRRDSRDESSDSVSGGPAGSGGSSPGSVDDSGAGGSGSGASSGVGDSAVADGAGAGASSGAAAGTIDGDGIAGGVSQTPGGKQITDGPNEGQKLHRTGLSGYENADGVESFSAAPGGELSGSSNTSRSEAYYSGDTAGKSFAADYKADVEGDVTIFQMKDNTGGSPEFRVTVDDAGDVVVNTGDGSPETLGKVKPGEEFRLSVKDNADGTTSFGLNDTSGASLGQKDLQSSNPIDSSQFRYGAYTQGDNTTANVMVSNVETDI